MSARTRTTATTRTTLTAGLTLGLATLTLSACGAGQDHDDADVAFATGMLPHHAQAIEMVEMTEGRDLDPEVQALAREIEAAQAPEIETMTGWLTEWDEPVPDTSGAAAMAGSDSMTGMMSGEEMTSLERETSDAAFQRQWLELMVEHHTGAVEMAEAEQADGQYEPAIELAGEIVDSQSAEIAEMRRLLSS